MIKEISTILLERDKRKILRAADIILWISLVFVTFNKWMYSVITIPLKEIDEIYRYIISASYIYFIEWTIIIVFIYFVAKLFLITILPKSSTIYKIYFKKALSESIQIPITDIIYKGTQARESHKNKARQYKSGINTRRNQEILDNSKLIIGILLKLIILGCIKMQGSDGPDFWVAVTSVVLSFLIVVVIELAIINARSQNKLYALISKLT